VGAVVVAAIAAVIASGGGGGKPTPTDATMAISGPFGQHYAGLVQRRQAAHVPTMMDSGTIHVEGVPGARLGQFFRVWGVPLSTSQLGPYRAGANDAVRMWVDGKPSTAFGQLELVDGQRIVVSFGPRDAPAPVA